MSVLLADETALVLKPTANGVYGPVDVGGWECDYIAVGSASGAGGICTVGLQWLDATGQVIANSPILYAGGNADQRVGELRHLGPYVNYVIAAGPGAATVIIEHHNRRLTGTGPIFPGQAGATVYAGTDAAVAGNSTVTHVLWGTGGVQQIQGFHGPAELVIRAGADIANVLIQDAVSGFVVGAVALGTLNQPGAATQRVTIPPRPCALIVQNGPTVQPIDAALILAGCA